MSTTIPQRALVIAAHPDDIEFGVAGTVCKWTDAGAQVTYVMVTDGAAGSNKPDTDLAALVRLRQEEECASAAVVGVQDVRFLGFADGYLQPTMEIRKALTRIIRELRPEIVVLQDPSMVFVQNFYINHPDHRAAGEAALYAVFPSAGTRPIFPELLEEGLEPHDVREVWLYLSPQPDTFVDISAQMERKLQALLCHQSQVSEEVTQMIRTWDGETGKAHGYTYAEDFRVMILQRDPPPEATTPA
jgi:LmbE family N-acetylglucosaminyl deacetylase